MKMFAKTLLVSSLLAGSAMTSAEEIGAGFDLSMNVTLASDYVWRGISQTQGKGAIQGGVDLAHESGFYIGAWASNVDFDSNASSEWDFYTGFAFDAGPVALDVGLLQYTYVDQSNLNFLEAYASAGIAGFTLGYHYQLAGESASEQTFDYIYASYDLELPAEFGLGFVVAQYDFKDATFFDGPLDLSGQSKYMHYGVTLSKTLLGMDMALTYSTTDLSDDECAGFAGKDTYCNDVVILSASKSF